MQSYTPSEAAAAAVMRVEKVSQTYPKYHKLHNIYTKKFSHLRAVFREIVCEEPEDAKSPILNDTVEGMIRMWQATGGRIIKLGRRDVQQLTDNPGKFAGDVKKYCNVLYAQKEFRVAQQTVGNYMSKGWLRYRKFGNERKPEKKQVNRARKYALVNGKIDYERLREYLKRTGLKNGPRIGEQGLSYDALAKRCKTLESQVHDLQKKYSKSQETITQKTKEANKQRTSKEVLEKQIKQVRTKRDELTSDKAKLKRKNASLQKQNQDFLARISEYEKAEDVQVKTLQQLATANKRADTLDSKVTELQNLYEGAESEIAKVSKELTAEKARVKELTKRKETLTQQRDEAIQLNKQYLAQISAFENTAKSKKTAYNAYNPKKSPEYAALLAQKETRDAQVKTLSQQLATANKTITNKEKNIDELHTQLEQLNTEYIALEARNEALLAENQTLIANNKPIKQESKPPPRKKETTIRHYNPSQIYSEGEKIIHDLWEAEGEVVSSDENIMLVRFDDKDLGTRPLQQGKKLMP